MSLTASAFAPADQIEGQRHRSRIVVQKLDACMPAFWYLLISISEVTENVSFQNSKTKMSMETQKATKAEAWTKRMAKSKSNATGDTSAKDGD